MALPPIEIDVRADTAQAEAALDRVGDTAATTGARVKTSTGKMTAGAVSSTRSFSVLGGQSRMLSQQLSQVAQQATATGQVGQALAVQAADIGLAFGTVGTIAGALIGIALPSLIRVFSDTGEEVVDTQEALDRFTSAMNRVDRASDIGVQSIAELRQEYGQFAEQVQFAARVVAQAALADGMREFGEVADALQTPLSGVASALDEYQSRVTQLEAVQRSLGERTISNAAAFDQYESAVDEARQAVVDAASDIGLTVRQAELLQGVLDRMATAEGPEQIAEQAGYALEIFDAMFTTASNIPPEIAQLVSELRAVQLAASQASANMEEMADAARALPMASGGLSGAGLGISAGMTGGDLLPPSAGDDDSAGGGGGRSRGRAMPTDTTEADLEALQERFMSETELVNNAHEERLELLRTARERELLTNQEYDELERKLAEDHAKELIDIDAWKHGDKLDQLEYGLGKAASALAGGNEKMVEISRKFAAIEATINAGRAFAQVAADPSLPWYAKIPAAIGVASAISSFANQSGIGEGGSSSAATTTAQEAEEPSITQNRSLTLIGDNFNRKQAIEIAEYINEGSDNGLIIR